MTRTESKRLCCEGGLRPEARGRVCSRSLKVPGGRKGASLRGLAKHRQRRSLPSPCRGVFGRRARTRGQAPFEVLGGVLVRARW